MLWKRSRCTSDNPKTPLEPIPQPIQIGTKSMGHLLAGSILLSTIALWSGSTGCCQREKRVETDKDQLKTALEVEKTPFRERTKTSSKERIEKTKEVGKDLTVPGILSKSSPRAKLEVQETQTAPQTLMSTQLSLMSSEVGSHSNKISPSSTANTSSKTKIRGGNSREEATMEETQCETELDNQVDLNAFILKAAESQLVVNPRLVKKKGNIDLSMLRSRSKQRLMELEAAMKSDKESEHDKDPMKESNKQKPTIKWGDSKCVVFETSSQPTFDDDEVIDEPDLYE